MPISGFLFTAMPQHRKWSKGSQNETLGDVLLAFFAYWTVPEPGDGTLSTEFAKRAPYEDYSERQSHFMDRAAPGSGARPDPKRRPRRRVRRHCAA